MNRLDWTPICIERACKSKDFSLSLQNFKRRIKGSIPSFLFYLYQIYNELKRWCLSFAQNLLLIYSEIWFLLQILAGAVNLTFSGHYQSQSSTGAANPAGEGNSRRTALVPTLPLPCVGPIVPHDLSSRWNAIAVFDLKSNSLSSIWLHWDVPNADPPTT